MYGYYGHPGEANLSGRFFEADGVTPVRILSNLSTVPEPSTMGLAIAGLVIFGLKARRV